jgi:hypothetical protein
VRKVALDGIPALRRRVLDSLATDEGAAPVTRDISDQIDYSTGAVHRTLEDLAALAFVQRESDPGAVTDGTFAIGCMSGSGSSRRHSARSERRMPYISPVRARLRPTLGVSLCASVLATSRNYGLLSHCFRGTPW